MSKDFYNLKLSYNSIVDIVKQLSYKQKEQLMKAIETINKNTKVVLNEEKIKSILREVRPFLSKNLGKYTHQKSSSDWSFVGFAFTKKDIGYVFGVNVGFFKKNKENLFTYAGMNVLIRTNGGEDILRGKILNFFRANLNGWSNQNEKIYSYPARGDEGIELARYKKIEHFASERQIINYIEDSILQFRELYPKIIKNEDLFRQIVRAAPKWDEEFIEICNKILYS